MSDKTMIVLSAVFAVLALAVGGYVWWQQDFTAGMATCAGLMFISAFLRPDSLVR